MKPQETSISTARTAAAPQAAAARADHAFIGRQPIYDRETNVIAYELLFRSSERNTAGTIQPFEATAQVLLNTIVEMGWDTLVGDKRAFVNFSRGFLLMDDMQELPPERVGIEVLEDTGADAQVLEAVANLSHQGYTIALDDFFYHEHLQPLIELADIIKLDVQAMDQPTLAEHVALLRPYNVALLAEKVETHDEFRYCEALGFDYFQGYFWCQPDIVKSQRSLTNRVALFQLFGRLNDPDVGFDELDTLISRDVSLSYKLLRLINSAYYGMVQKISSVRQAILLLGTKSIQSLVSLMLLSGIDDKPHELGVIALMRAKTCELLLPDNSGTSFLVGLFSVLDALLDRPMSEVVENLPVTPDVTQALVDHEGILGDLLHWVIAYERGYEETSNLTDLGQEEMTTAYREALAWATETDRVMAGTAAPGR